ncbi:hypothetical protein KGP36_04185 [Patescibacteria group bacterium]|nr:hypothetical protein [Patescibacteria group bacterium]
MSDDKTENINPDELRELKTQYNKAKDLLEKISAIRVRYDEAFKALEDRKTDVSKISDDARERFSSIENIKNESAKYLSDIKSNLEKIQLDLDKIADALQKIENTKGKIEGRGGEVEALVSTVTALKGDIEKIKDSAQKRLGDIDKLLSDVQTKLTQVQEAYQQFVAINAKITDKNTGLQAILDNSIILQKQTGTVLAEIKTFRDQSKELLDEINKNKSEIDQVGLEIEKILEEAKLDKDEVKKITALITDTGFEYAFQKRERMLRWSSITWLVILLVSIAVLAYMLYSLFAGYFTDLTKVPEVNIVIFRFLLTSPLIFIIGVAIKQYGNERILNEKYAFKAVLAAVIRNHSKFLVEIKDQAGPDNAEFFRKVIGDLYSEVHDSSEVLKDDRKEEKDRKKWGKVVLKIKELKSLFPDGLGAKDIADLISKLK